jgi:hypothetical protein
MRLACDITLMTGRFASQPLAFAHILDAAERQGRSLDLDNVEVVGQSHAARLAAWFDADTCANIMSRLPSKTTIIAFLPASGGPLEATDLLTPLGRFAGTLIRAPLPRTP